jgi:hypothetical protein
MVQVYTAFSVDFDTEAELFGVELLQAMNPQANEITNIDMKIDFFIV